MPPRPSLLEVFFVALHLGCTSFGGPVAPLAYFRKEYVEKRRWLDEAHYADLVALCQFLPGPASSQTGFGVGYLQRGLAGGLAAPRAGARRDFSSGAAPGRGRAALLAEPPAPGRCPSRLA